MIFPRLFTCPTLTTDTFKVGTYRRGVVAVSRLDRVCLGARLIPTRVLSLLWAEFEVNIVVLLATGDKITENFPIKLVRS